MVFRDVLHQVEQAEERYNSRYEAKRDNNNND
ncbi:hypothetical protein PSM36_1522 [Proteiniphilum saccharofermentans]|uniref:Uncharacterized protein n=1 Tax=Proteiniphilum saccharofermentans TaxID=1642647 RepID=A0A1R3T2Q9_9BACT|nr:hypothetical protein PSM36_1522 [Proteiniphilum saccharofermentans]SDZ89480.1 hypothetical protein SAMN05216331_10946 [Porphyromonadaceae bacterium KH3R12]SFS58613.1 hypothetical protein SAMN05216365_11131 [Porphyromonadaceae bacterium NLAE-zl-C104]